MLKAFHRGAVEFGVFLQMCTPIKAFHWKANTHKQLTSSTIYCIPYINKVDEDVIIFKKTLRYSIHVVNIKHSRLPFFGFAFFRLVKVLICQQKYIVTNWYMYSIFYYSGASKRNYCIVIASIFREQNCRQTDLYWTFTTLLGSLKSITKGGCVVSDAVPTTVVFSFPMERSFDTVAAAIHALS